MIQIVQSFSVVATLGSCFFWIAGAGIRIRRRSLFTVSGPDSLVALLRRQSLMNAFAASFAALAAAGQAVTLLVQTG